MVRGIIWVRGIRRGRGSANVKGKENISLLCSAVVRPGLEEEEVALVPALRHTAVGVQAPALPPRHRAAVATSPRALVGRDDVDASD